MRESTLTMLSFGLAASFIAAFMYVMSVSGAQMTSRQVMLKNHQNVITLKTIHVQGKRTASEFAALMK